MAPGYPAYQDETVGKNTCTSSAHQPYARRLDSSCIVCLADECCVAVRGTLSTLVARFCPLRSGADPHPRDGATGRVEGSPGETRAAPAVGPAGGHAQTCWLVAHRNTVCGGSAVGRGVAVRLPH